MLLLFEGFGAPLYSCDLHVRSRLRQPSAHAGWLLPRCRCGGAPMLMAIETVGYEFGVDSSCDDAANGLAGAHTMSIDGFARWAVVARLSPMHGSPT